MSVSVTVVLLERSPVVNTCLLLYLCDPLCFQVPPCPCVYVGGGSVRMYILTLHACILHICSWGPGEVVIGFPHMNDL